MVEGARLESVCRGNSTEGSNPSPPPSTFARLLAASAGRPRASREGCRAVARKRGGERRTRGLRTAPTLPKAVCTRTGNLIRCRAQPLQSGPPRSVVGGRAYALNQRVHSDADSETEACTDEPDSEGASDRS